MDGLLPQCTTRVSDVFASHANGPQPLSALFLYLYLFIFRGGGAVSFRRPPLWIAVIKQGNHPSLQVKYLNHWFIIYYIERHVRKHGSYYHFLLEEVTWFLTRHATSLGSLSLHLIASKLKMK